MKTLDVHRLIVKDNNPSMEEISIAMDSMQDYDIDTINWPDFSYNPDVQFAIAYTNNELIIKYYVSEAYFRAEITEPNGNVYEDSCVEFFVSPRQDGIYYNFEFNALGTCLMGSGMSRHDRIRTAVGVIAKIRTLPSFSDTPPRSANGNYFWNLTVAIPAVAFFHHEIESFSETVFRGNFYKCGDRTRIPHYLSWNPVQTIKPDFHKPEFFGILNFH